MDITYRCNKEASDKAAYKLDSKSLSNKILRKGGTLTMRKLKRDIVVSVNDEGKDLVGIYYADTDGSEALLECSPTVADIRFSPDRMGN